MKMHTAPSLPLILLAATAGALGARPNAQCQTATVRVIDASPPNPIRLSTVFPYEYAVINNSIQLEALGAEANSFGVLWLTGRRTNYTLPGVLDGTLLVDPLGARQFAYVQIPRWTFAIPSWIQPGMRLYAQSIHSRSGGGYQLSNALEVVAGFYQAEIAVVDVQVPADLVGGVGPRPYRVTLRNQGNAPATANVTVRIGVGAGSTFTTVPVGPVPPFSSFEATLLVPTPAPAGPCGSSFVYDVTACSAFSDCDPSNDCFLSTARVATAFWDLDFDIVDAPGSAHRGTFINWKVRVRNIGNVPSPSGVGALTGINCSPGSRNFGCNLGLDFFSVPSIGAGLSWDRDVFGNASYFISGGAFTGTQYIKAEVNYTDGTLDDACNPGNNNYAEVPITIQP